MTTNERIARSIATQPDLRLHPDGEVDVNQYGNTQLPRSEASKARCAANAFGRGKRKGKKA